MTVTACDKCLRDDSRFVCCPSNPGGEAIFFWKAQLIMKCVNKKNIPRKVSNVARGRSMERRRGSQKLENINDHTQRTL